jgi:hypothetical protein
VATSRSDAVRVAGHGRLSLDVGAVAAACCAQQPGARGHSYPTTAEPKSRAAKCLCLLVQERASRRPRQKRAQSRDRAAAEHLARDDRPPSGAFGSAGLSTRQVDQGMERVGPAFASRGARAGRVRVPDSRGNRSRAAGCPGECRSRSEAALGIVKGPMPQRIGLPLGETTSHVPPNSSTFWHRISPGETSPV